MGGLKPPQLSLGRSEAQDRRSHCGVAEGPVSKGGRRAAHPPGRLQSSCQRSGSSWPGTEKLSCDRPLCPTFYRWDHLLFLEAQVPSVFSVSPLSGVTRKNRKDCI